MTAMPPGSTIGILGGGQLGRMLAMAAAQLGYRCHVLAPEADSVAAEVSAAFTCADYTDSGAMIALANECAVITYEFENVPVAPLRQIEHDVPLRPSPNALEIAQSRVDEKSFARDQGGITAPFALADSYERLCQVLEEITPPVILKTTRFGYDGKGQVRIDAIDDADRAWQAIDGKPAIVEGFVRFEREYSVILVRGADGDIRYWDTCENRHESGILAHTSVPAHPDILAQEPAARALAAKVAEALGYVGVLTMEFFAGEDGPVFNEMAPRVHNSGHWTIEGALTSQFENHIRAICGVPLGDTRLAATRVTMDNLIGDEADGWPAILADPSAHLHLYGKDEARAGRKMGHVTRLEF